MPTFCTQHLSESKTQLKTGRLKITSARLRLLDILKHAKKPLNVKQISKALGRIVDPVTLYRNIESLENLGIIKQVRLLGREAYYELTGEHHHHIVCENCGKVSDVKTCAVSLPKSSAKTAGFAKVNRHSLEFFGLCTSCVKKF